MVVASRARWSNVLVGFFAVGSLLGVDVMAADLASAAAPVVVASPAAVRPTRVTEAADVVAARVSARAQGSRVEAVAERTEFTSTFVNPDGTLTTEASAARVRFRDKADGNKWRNVDLTLREAGGQVTPTSSDLGLTLSAGAAAGADFVSIDHDAATTGSGSGKASGRSIAWALGGSLKGARLPKPVLSGTSATYPDVAPGVDVRVQARPRGFEQDFIVKDRAAADAVAAAGGSFTIPLKTKGLRAGAVATGGVEFVDAKGARVSFIPPAFAWDARVDPRSGEAARVPVTLSVTQANPGNAALTVTPDAAWLADPARVFPVTVDPTYATVNAWVAGDTWAATNYPSSDMSADPELKVGTYDGGTTKARSWVLFPISGFRGYDVVSANLSLWNTYSASCTPKPVYAYDSGWLGSATRWGNQPTRYALAGQASAAKGFSSSCPGGRFTIPVTAQVQGWAATSNTYFAFQLAASETDSAGWKRFSSGDGSAWPYVSITYNRKPNVAATPALGSPAVSYTPTDLATPTTYTSDKRPSFSTVASDPDGSRVKYIFEVFTTPTPAVDATPVASCTTALVVSGTTASCGPSVDLGDNRSHWVRASVRDERGVLNPTYSAMKRFRTAFAAPPAPAVSCPAPYTNGSWADTLPAANVSCTVTGAGTGTTAPASILYSLDGSAEKTVAITQSTDPAVAKIVLSVPKTQGAHSIKVRTKSPAALLSGYVTYGFGYGNANLTAPVAPAGQRPVSTGKITVTAAGPPRGTSTGVTASVRWRVAGSGTDELTGWNTAPTTLTATKDDTTGVIFTGSWDTMSATSDTSLDSDPVASGVQPTTLNPRVPVNLDVQICLTYTGTPTSTQCTWSDTASKRTITRVPHAFGNGFPTAAAGPGQVALFTGEFNTDTTDVSVPGYSGALSLSRSHSTYGNDPNTAIPAAQGVFGPGWTAALDGSDDGLAGLTVYDATHQDGTLAFVDTDGSAMIYAPSASPTANVRRTGASLTSDPLTPVTWVALDEDTQASGITLKVSGAGTGTTLELVEEEGTTTTFTAGTGAPATGKAGVFTPTSVTVPNAGTTSYAYNAAGLVTRILAPNPELDVAAACPVGAETAGCRALTVTYATVGPAGQPSLQASQVSQVDLRIYNPTAALPVTSCAGTTSAAAVGMVTVPVACYTYDTPTRRLLAVKDPRNGLSTSYTYGSANELTSVDPDAAGPQAPTSLVYATSDSRLKLASVTRVAPSTIVDGPTGAPGSTVKLARFVYDVPTTGSGTGTGLPDLSSTGVDRWGQSSVSVPTYAAGVFGPDYTGTDPPVSAATGSTTGVDWTFADLSYTTAAGYTVNTAGYGAGQWLFTRTDYDDDGHEVFTLDEGAIADILTFGVAANGHADLSSWGTTTVYNPDTTTMTDAAVVAAKLPKKSPAGSVVTDTYRPSRTVWYPDGSNDLIRPHTHTDYDQGAPNAGIDAQSGIGYALATTVTTTADSSGSNQPSDPTGPVTGRTLNGYHDQAGSDTSATAGWTLHAATTVTTDMDLDGVLDPAGPGGIGGDITATTYYDARGRTVESRQPKSASGAGTDAGTTVTSYYTVAAQTGANTSCGGKPQWAGLTCRTTLAAQATSGAVAQSLPDSQVTGYSYLLAPTTVVQTSTAPTTVTRTTTTSYLLDGRVDTTTTATTGLTGSQASTSVPATVNTYSATTGALELTATTDAGGATISSLDPTYDTWGRAYQSTTTYPGGSTDTASTGYDAAGRAVTATDPRGVTTYTYDGGPGGTDAAGKAERRGKVTTLTTTRTGTSATTSTGASNLLTYAGAYDADGNLTTQTLPGGLTQTTSYDEVGQPVGLSYSGQVTDYTESLDPGTGQTLYTPGAVHTGDWLAWSTQRDTNGRVLREYTGAGAGFDGNPGVTDPTDILAPGVGDARAGDRGYGYDQGGRLTTVTDRTAAATGTVLDPSTPASTAIPCTVRTYGFDANGNRTTLTTAAHADGNCTGTASSTSSVSYGYDEADRPTTSVDPDAGGPATPAATYSYDGLGRQTLMPAADAPDPTRGDVTLGYDDTDLPRSITHGPTGNRTTTTYDLDAAQRRWKTTSTNTSTDPAIGGTTTTYRHYTDSSDNPAWTDTTRLPAGGGAAVQSVTRYTGTLSGDLGAQVTDTPGATGPTGQGEATLTLANPHGDVVTTVTIPADTTETTPAVTIDGWADYTEYGLPAAGTTPTSQAAIAGQIGYGWLGAKQRATTTEAAGLTLMGVRLYNNTRGLFTSTDPVPGGNTTAYTYPQDPTNGYDLNGQWWGSDAWNSAKQKVSSGWSRATSSRAWNNVARWGRQHQGLLNGVGKTLGVVSYLSGYCPLAQCQAVAVGSGLLSAGAYAWAGNKRDANRALVGTAYSLLTGGRGRWLGGVGRASRWSSKGGLIGRSMSGAYRGMNISRGAFRRRNWAVNAVSNQMAFHLYRWDD